MRYLIIPVQTEPFYTDWFVYDNHFTAGMRVFDLYSHTFTIDGETWKAIEVDHL